MRVLMLFCAVSCFGASLFAQPLADDSNCLLIPAIQTLYARCANPVTLYPLEKSSTETLVNSQTDGGSILIDSLRPNSLFLVPTAKTFLLSELTTQKGRTLPVQPIEFFVVKPPPPSLRLFVNGKEYASDTPISKRDTLTLVANPDPIFLGRFPQDARYKIQSVTLMHQNWCAGGKIGTYTSQPSDSANKITLKLPRVVRNGPSGSKYYLKVTAVHRLNFQNQLIPEGFLERDLYFSFKVR